MYLKQNNLQVDKMATKKSDWTNGGHLSQQGQTFLPAPVIEDHVRSNFMQESTNFTRR